MGLTLTASPDTSLVAYSDANWVGCPDTRRPTYGYCVYLGPSLISWSSKLLGNAVISKISYDHARSI